MSDVDAVSVSPAWATPEMEGWPVASPAAARTGGDWGRAMRAATATSIRSNPVSLTGGRLRRRASRELQEPGLALGMGIPVARYVDRRFRA